MADEGNIPTRDQVIHAKDITENYYDKTTVDGLISDPSYNTTASCVGYDMDILGGY